MTYEPTKPVQIKTLAALMKVTSDKRPHQFRLILKYGLFSRKIIHRIGDTFYIHNAIDETNLELNSDEIMDKNLTNINEAMKKGAFVMI